jgi:hypothetical protein
MKNQLHSISEVNSGLEVRVLPGSPLIPKGLLFIPVSARFAHHGDFCVESIPKFVSS